MARPPNLLIVFVLIGCVAPPVARAADEGGDYAVGKIQRGEFTTSFTERHPLNTMAEQRRRLDWEEPPGDYDITKETYEVVVPEDYDPATPYGLLVWISPSPSGRLPSRGGWDAVLARHKIIWVGANEAGNHNHIYRRGGLALDAAHNMPKRYNIDPRRIYVGGMSGGGFSSSIFALGYADVFAGGYYMCGTHYFRHMPVAGKENTFYKGRFKPPAKTILDRAKQQGRYVLLTGSTDANRGGTLSSYENGYKKDRFAHVTYIEVPGMGHSLPDGEWFEKGIAFLDTVPQDATTQPISAPATRPVAAAPARDAAEAPAQLLQMAENYIVTGKYDSARIRLQKILDDHPNSPEAAAAKKRLATLPKAN